MADGDIAAAVAGWTPTLAADDIKLGYQKINQSADLSILFGQVRLANAAAIAAYTTNARLGQRAVDLATGDEYRWNGTTWQLWNTIFRSYTPTFGGFTLGNGVLTVAGFRYLEGMVFAVLAVQLGSTSSVTGGLLASLPVAPVAQQVVTGKAHVTLGGTLRPAYPTFSSLTGTQLRLRVMTVSGANVVSSDISATVPATWATGDVFEVSVLYRVY